MRDCIVIINDPVLRELLGADQFDTFADLVKTVEEKLLNTSFSFNNNSYTITQYQDQNTDEIKYELENLTQNQVYEFSNIENVISYVFSNMGSMFEYLNTAKSIVVNNLNELESLISNSGSSTENILNLITSTNSLIEDIKQKDPESAFEFKTRLNTIYQKYNQVSEKAPDSISLASIELEAIQYFYPTTNLYDKTDEGYNYSSKLLDVARVKLANAIEQYEKKTGNKVYLSLRKDTQDNTQTGVFPDSKLGVIGELYVKVNDKFERLYIKEGSVNPDPQSKIELTTDINDAEALGENNSKLFTVVVPDFENPKYQRGFQIIGVNPRVIKDLSKIRRAVKSGTKDFAFLKFDSIYHTYPKYYYTAESNRRKVTQPVKKFLRGRSYNDVELVVISSKNIKNYKLKSLEVGNVVAIIDGTPVKVYNSLQNTELFNEIYTLLNHTFTVQKELDSAVVYLNKLFYYETAAGKTSILKFEASKNKIVLLSKYSVQKVKSKTTGEIYDELVLNPNNEYKEVLLGDLKLHLNSAKFNIDKDLVSDSSTIEKYYIKDGVVKKVEVLSKNLYLDNLNTAAEQVKVKGKYQMLPQAFPVFDVNAIEYLIPNPADEQLKSKETVIRQTPILVKDYLNAATLNKTTDEILRILIEVSKGATNNLAKRLDESKIVFDENQKTNYDPNSNTITIGNDVDITKPEELNIAIIHELIHLVVSPWLDNNPNHIITKRLNEVAEILKSDNIVRDDNVIIHEILAKLSDPKYRSQLKNHKSILDDVIDLLRQIFEKLFNKKQSQIDSNTYNRLIGEMLAIVKAEADSKDIDIKSVRSKRKFLEGSPKNNVQELINQFEDDRKKDILKFENAMKTIDTFIAATIDQENHTFTFLRGQLSFKTLFNSFIEFVNDIEKISLYEQEQFKNDPEALKIVNARLNFAQEILANPLKYEYYIKKYSAFLTTTNKVKLEKDIVNDQLNEKEETTKPSDTYSTQELADVDNLTESTEQLSEEDSSDEPVTDEASEQKVIEAQITEAGNDKTFDRSGVESSSLKSADREVLAFIKMNAYQYKEDKYGEKNVVEVTDDQLFNSVISTNDPDFGYEVVLDENGVPASPDLYVFWNTLQRIVAGANNFEEMLNRMTYENASKYNVPEIGYLGDKIRRMLDQASGSNKKDIVAFTTRMYRALNRYNTPMMTVAKVEEAPDSSVGGRTKTNFNVLVYGTELKSPALKHIMRRITETMGLSEEIGLIVNNSFNVKKALELYRTDESLFIRRMGLRIPLNVQNNSSFKRFLELLVENLERSREQFIPLNYIEHFISKESTVKIKDFTSAWNNFIRRWDETHPFFRSQMRLNAENELQSDYSIGAAIFKDLSYIQQTSDLDELRNKVPRLNTYYGQASRAIGSSLRSKMKIFNYNGYEYTVKGKKKGRKTIKLDPTSYLIQSLTSFFKEGVMENIRAQVATTSLALKIQWGPNRTDIFPFSLELVDEMFEQIGSSKDVYPKIPQAIFKQLLEYLRADLLTHGQPMLMSAMFPNTALGTQEDIDAMIDSIDNYLSMPLMNKDGTLNTLAYDDIIENLETQAAEFIKAEAISTVALFEDNFVSDIIADSVFFQNFKINNTNAPSLRRMYAMFSFFSYIYKIEEIIMFHGDIAQIGKFYKRSNSQQSTGIMADTSPTTLEVVKEMLENESFGSLVGSPLKIDENYESAVMPDDERSILEVNTSLADIRTSLQAYSKSKGFKMSVQEENAFMDLYNVYKKSNVSDGAAYIHPDAYKVFMMMVGQDTKDFDTIHRANYLQMKKETGQSLTESEQSELDTLMEHIFSGKVQLPTLKFSYRGPGTQNESYLEVFDKFALVPLFPNMFPQDHPGRKMFTFMSNNNLAYVKFKSGTKFLGLNQVTGSMSEFVKLLEDPNYELNADSKHQLKTEYLKEQIKTPSKPKMDNTLGVQFRELIISSITNKKLIDTWTELLQKYVGSKQLSALKSLGFTLTNNRKLKIDSRSMKENLGRILIEGVKSRELPISVLNFVEEYSKIKDPSKAHAFFEASMNSSMLENIISSMINKMVTVKVPGAMFIQIPPSIFGDNLKFYRSQDAEGGFEVLRAQTKITMPKHMFGMLNIPELSNRPELKTVEQKFNALNALMKNEAFRTKYAKQLTIITYRIPTQEYNSMEVFEIVEFLPPWFGPHIVLPPGITTKSGTDFDYDKMSSLLPVLDKNGNIKDNSLVNTMITSISTHLLHKNNFFRLLKPTSPDDVMSEVKFVLDKLGVSYKDPQGGDILKVSTWFNKWNAVKMKDMLGIAATWNRLYSVMSNNFFELNSFYTTDYIVDQLPLQLKYVTSFSYDQADVGKGVHDESIRSSIDSKTNKVKQFYKWDLLCQFINVTVDASSDDTFGYTNIDKDMFAIAMYMMFVKNIPLNITLQFLHHPVVQRFEKLKKKYQLVDGVTKNKAKKLAFEEIYEQPFFSFGQVLLFAENYTNEINIDNVMFGETKELHEEKFNTDPNYDAEGDISILSHYLFLIEETNQMFKIQSAIDVDKNYDSRMPLAEGRTIKINDVKYAGFDKNNFVDRILQKSTRSAFHIAPFTKEIYRALYPILYNRLNQNAFKNMLDSKSIKSVLNDEQYYRASSFDFLLSLVQTFGRTHKGESIADRVRPYIKNPFGFFKKINEIEKLITDRKLRILSEAFVLNSQKIDQGYVFAAQFFTGFDNSVQDKNILHEELVYMLNHPNEQVRDFAYDIIYIGMVQSGWRKSRYYFNDILPESVTTPIVFSAISKFSLLNSKAKESFLSAYAEAFSNAILNIDSPLFRNLQLIEFKNQKIEDTPATREDVEIDITTTPETSVEYAEYEDVTPESIAAALPSAESVVPGSLPTQPTVSNNPAEFTNHSGGAKGYDAEWDLIGAKFGMVNNKHYLLPIDGEVSDPRLKAKGVKPVDATTDIGNVAQSGPATGEAQIAVTNAERIMGRIESNHVTRNTKKIRNYAQVKNADGIFAIGSLIPKGADITVAKGQTTKKALVPQVNGGTSVAVQLGIMMNKPTYVFNQVANNTYPQGWYKWDASKQDFLSVNTPILTKNFAGIGTSSNTTEQGKQAIRDVYTKTFAASTTQSTVQPSKFTHARTADNSYEVSSAGDKRFSALYAKLSNGRTIEDVYQKDIKSKLADKDASGNPVTSQIGKGKVNPNISYDTYYTEYKKLWDQWAKENPQLIEELRQKAQGKVLTDKFASSPVSQARALADILNETATAHVKPSKSSVQNEISVPKKESKKITYTLYNLKTNKNVTKTGYKIIIPEFPDVELYLTNENATQESQEGTTEFNSITKDWYVEVNTKDRGALIVSTPFASNQKDVLKEFAEQINKYLKSKTSRQVLKSIGISFDVEPVEEALPAAEITTAPTTPAANMDEASPQLFDPNNKVIQSGSLVLYNGQKYLVYEIDDKDSTRMNLVSPKGQILKSVPEKDLIVQGKYKVVLHTNRVNYIVTDKENIYSTKNGKLSYTATDNATATQRNMILRKAYEGVIVPANPKAGIDQPAVGRHPILDARTNSSTFKYTPLQAKALTEIGQLLQQSGNKYYVLAGYAGTGKTTLVENIYNYAKSLNREILIMAPTNKAASNITQKLNAVNITESARTIHGSIYGQPRLNEETGQLKFSVKLKNISNSLIIIDESSMLDTKTLTDMLRIVKSGYNNMIVFMGDSFQLEIGNESSNILTYYKDYENFNKKFGIKVDGYTELTEVMRQQLESDILKTATLTRILNRPIAFDNIDPKEIDFKTTANRSVMLNAFIGNLRRNEDAVYIVGTNDSKVEINHRVREGLHEADANVLVKNEILMSVNNSIFNNNGDIFKVKSIDTPLQEFTIQLQKKNSDGKTEYKNYKVYIGLITGNDNVPRPIVLIPELNLPSVDGSIITSSNRDIKKLLTDLKTYTGDDAPVGKTFVVATYGYAITAHKAQGSQWETVYVDQNSKSKSALEWYYTAITRATKYVRLLQNLEIHYMYTANMINAEFVRIEEEERSKIEQCNPNQTML